MMKRWIPFEEHKCGPEGCHSVVRRIDCHGDLCRYVDTPLWSGESPSFMSLHDKNTAIHGEFFRGNKYGWFQPETTELRTFVPWNANMGKQVLNYSSVENPGILK